MKDDDCNPIVGFIQIIIIIWLITMITNINNDVNQIKHDTEILKLSHCYADTPVTTNVKEK